MDNIKKILAIETSCDDTSCAIIDSNKAIIANIVQSQYDVHREYNGIVPELASRHHLENINFIISEALVKADCSFDDIDAIAVTVKPGLAGSLLVGVMTAKALSYALKKPLIEIDHLDAHIWANFMKYKPNTEIFKPRFPALVLLVSGGHTDLYFMNSYSDFYILGRTRDDAVGEAFDKVGKLLDLGYPGGPVIDKISAETTGRVTLPKPFMSHTYDFSFSGLKTAVLQVFKKKKFTLEDKHILAASFQDVVVEVLLRKMKKGIKEFGIQTIMLSGGVAANSQLRDAVCKLAKDSMIACHFPPRPFCTDNAAMVGARAIDLIK
ncbi:MAG: tRNA (adenosine(37)-N6)-threonylcarbamoyltransferase complex transferase subunit TsaD [bacterium]|nr:tRNA (adenosine(37)-N6)-threonylcarbamoyltransferase complex transferase subunit TsaD [bacterium]